MNCNYALSGGHEVTLEIASEILRDGGNAFDAAIAAHFAMYLTEPCMASAGAGGFAMCYKHGAKPMMLDFFTQTPLGKQLYAERDFDSIRVDFGNETEEFFIGMASIATPGSVAGMFELYTRFASRPIEVLLEPVMALAKKGVALNKFQSIDIGLLEPVFYRDESVRDLFFKDGQLIQEGDHFDLPLLNDFFQYLIDEGRDGFYKGEISRLIDEDSRNKGGYIRRDDLENYKVFWRKPINCPFAGHNVMLPNGPSIGGALCGILLKYYERSGDWLQATIELKERNLSLTEISNEVNHLVANGEYDLASRHASNKGTSHFNILDKWGNAVALTCTIGEGSGYFVPGTNMQMNNMLGEAFLLPEGFHKWMDNTRLNSMMTPVLAFDSDDKLRFICGSGGAGRIPYMTAQMLDFVLKKEMSLEKAMEHPRVYLHHGTNHFEQGYAGPLTKRYPNQEWKERSLFFGGVHSIAIKNNSVDAIGDPRRYGAQLMA